MNNLEQIKDDIKKLETLNYSYNEKIKNLNYVLGNLKLEYPSLLIYKGGKIFINSEFDFSKSFVTKDEVETLITLLKELTIEVNNNEFRIKEVNERIQEG